MGQGLGYRKDLYKEYLKEGAKSEDEQLSPSLLTDGLRAQDESRNIS